MPRLRRQICPLENSAPGIPGWKRLPARAKRVRPENTTLQRNTCSPFCSDSQEDILVRPAGVGRYEDASPPPYNHPWGTRRGMHGTFRVTVSTRRAHERTGRPPEKLWGRGSSGGVRGHPRIPPGVRAAARGVRSSARHRPVARGGARMHAWKPYTLT